MEESFKEGFLSSKNSHKIHFSNAHKITSVTHRIISFYNRTSNEVRTFEIKKISDKFSHLFPLSPLSPLSPLTPFSHLSLNCAPSENNSWQKMEFHWCTTSSLSFLSSLPQLCTFKKQFLEKKMEFYECTPLISPLSSLSLNCAP